ncbi:MAG: FAD-dependent oxidoreductase [Actinobacteria bacterium]|nr:FAD-dependent oxidoreductase [Actinomycetota bacterium]
MERYELIVIGGGPAGITLAKNLGNKMKIAVIRPEEHSMIYCAMPYVIEGFISIEKTFKKDELVTDSGADLIRGQVNEIDFAAKSVMLSDGKQFKYNKLVIASGAIPFIPLVEGRNLNGVMSFKTVDDLKALKEFTEKKENPKQAVIVGAGAIGIELAQALNATGVVTTLIDMEKSILPAMIDPEMADLPTESLIKKGIHVILGAKVKALSGSEFISSVHLDNGKVIEFENLDSCTVDSDGRLNRIVVFSAGMLPDISFIKDKNLEIGKGGIIVNEKMETSIKDVYACGDCVEFKSGITGKTAPGKLATNAVPMAKVLSRNIMGENRKYAGFFNGAATRVYDFFIGGTGLTESLAHKAGYKTVTGYSRSTTQFPIMPDAKTLDIKLISDIETGRLIGGQVVSGEPVTDKIDLLTFAIQNESTVKTLAELSYSAQPFQSFFPAANALVMAAEEILNKIK